MPTLLGGRYEFQRIIGSGSFGVVRLYRDTLGPAHSVVAIKSIPYSKILQEGHRLIREIEIMLFLRDQHPHVITCFAAFATLDAHGVQHVSKDEIPILPDEEQAPRTLECFKKWVEEVELIKSHVEQSTRNGKPLKMDHTDDSSPPSFTIHLVLPFMNGDVDRFIDQSRRGTLWSQTTTSMVHPNFFSITVAVIAFQVLFGMDFLHKSSIVHRDLKPENILLRLDHTNAYCTSAIIADFGLACRSDDTGTFYVCTRTYRPPELIVARQTAHSSIDIWSLGCVFYELVTNHRLFDIPSSRDRAGEWNGGQAAAQLEAIMNIAGTPSHDDVRKYLIDDSDPVKSYLLRTAPRPSRLRELIEANFAVRECAADVKALWIDLIMSCLQFFPEQRPTAEDLCKHALFASFGMLYGDNVTQCPATPYTPTAVISSRPEKNVMTALNQLFDGLTREITESLASPVLMPMGTPSVLPTDPSQIQGSRRLVSFPFLRTEDVSDKYSAMPLKTMEDVLDATDSCEFDLNDVKEKLRELPDDVQLKIRMEDLRNLLNYLEQLMSWEEPEGEEEDA